MIVTFLFRKTRQRVVYSTLSFLSGWVAAALYKGRWSGASTSAEYVYVYLNCVKNQGRAASHLALPGAPPLIYFHTQNISGQIRPSPLTSPDSALSPPQMNRPQGQTLSQRKSQVPCISAAAIASSRAAMGGSWAVE
jgi:hypothetical protein